MYFTHPARPATHALTTDTSGSQLITTLAIETETPAGTSGSSALPWALATAALLWCARPPLGWWPCALFALIPLVEWSQRSVDSAREPRRRWLSAATRSLWFAGTVLAMVSLQGLRHAHPLMFLPLAALSLYLGFYFVVLVHAARSLRDIGIGDNFCPVILAVPIAWVAIEVAQNYLWTGLSAVMLGHSVADVPVLIQIADLSGTYGVSFVVATINVALWQLGTVLRRRASLRAVLGSLAWAGLLVTATVLYGRQQIARQLPELSTTFALIQRDEQTEYDQSAERAEAIFHAYASDSLDATAHADREIDALVWPESTMTGGVPWIARQDSPPSDPTGALAPGEFEALLEQNRAYFCQRLNRIQRTIATDDDATPDGQRPPHLIGGCGVVRYDTPPKVYSGLVHVDPSGRVVDWYAKTHLVMFGEYIPLVHRIPIVRDWIPAGLGITPGKPGIVFNIDETTVAPSICIETAVERVTIGQMRDHVRRGQRIPDVVVTVTNDAWFDHSSVVAHHLRCAQLVAVGIRRPILSAANGGPTAWIDSSGRVVRRIGFDQNGAILASPKRDERTSLYVRIGDWPAFLLTAITVAAVVFRRRKNVSGTEA